MWHVFDSYRKLKVRHWCLSIWALPGASAVSLNPLGDARVIRQNGNVRHFGNSAESPF